MKRFLMLFTFSLGLFVGCASPTEKDARRDNAFDLSGSYKTQQSSEVAMTFDIINQGSRHDIQINATRLSPNLSDKESALLKSKNMDPDRVAQHFNNRYVMGHGDDRNNLEGGNNISDDFGASSRFAVCSDPFQYNANDSVRYCMRGTAVKAQKTMSGELALVYTRSEDVKDKDGKTTTKLTYAEVTQKYTVDMNAVFYKQYLGRWSGSVYSLNSNFSAKSFNQLVISTTATSSMVTPDSSQQTIIYGGENYVYALGQSTTALSALSDPEYPAVQLVFANAADPGKRILVVGQIWSLGDLTGSVVLVDDHSFFSTTSLADFKFKKQ